MKENKKWLITTFILTFALAMVFGGVSNVVIEKMNLVMAIIVLAFVIALGIVFDMIGMAIATCEEAPFHAKAAKKHSGAKEVLRLLKAKDRATNISNDLIGDICGIVSGSTGAVIAIKMVKQYDLNSLIITLLVMGIISALTIGGKALEKGFAMKKSNNILFNFARILSIFSKE